MSNTTQEETLAIVSGAHRAYEQARDASPQARAGWLTAAAEALELAADELVPLADSETHLGAARLESELARTVFQLRLLATEVECGETLDCTIDHAEPAWGSGPRPDLRRMNVPLGVVGVFGASNFPFAFSVMGGDSASALAAGCAVVHKVHDGHLQLGLRVSTITQHALRAAGAPEGLFTSVVGRVAAEALVDAPLTRAVGFTGSTAGGRALFDRASQRPEPIPFFGELGSINPVFVTAAAWRARRVEILAGYVASFTLGMGQFCTKPGVLVVPATERAEVGDAIRHALAGTTQHPMLNERLRESFSSSLHSMAAFEGVEVLVEGTTEGTPRPTVLATTLSAIAQNPEILDTEMFGPASVVVFAEPDADLGALAQQFSGQLTCTIHAEPGEDVAALLAPIASRCGRVVWNAWPTGVAVSYAQNHGGPYPSSTSAGATSVGPSSARRFARAVSFQSFPDDRLPAALRDGNPLNLRRRVDGVWHERTVASEATSSASG